MISTPNTIQSRRPANLANDIAFRHFGILAAVGLVALLSAGHAHATSTVTKAPDLEAAESHAVPDAPGVDGTVDTDAVDAPPSTFASVDYLTAFVSGRTVIVEWRTSSELGTIGFDLLRRDPATGSFRKLNDALLAGLIVHPEGGVYRFRDDDAPLEGSSTYKLVEVDFRGRQRERGPFVVAPSSQATLETASGPVEEAGWSGEDLFQRRPNEIAKARQESTPAADAEGLDAGEAAMSTAATMVKLTASGQGLYYVPALLIGNALGMTADAAAALIANGQVDLTSLGADLSYLPRSDEGGKGLYFYANQPQTIYSAESAYLLAAGKGRTMNGAQAGTGGTAATSFSATLHSEENHYPLPAFFTDPDGDFWCWDYVVAGPGGLNSKSFTIHVPGVAATGKPSLTVHLHGGSDTPGLLNNHAVVFWNGTQVGEARWYGTRAYNLTIPLSAAAVQEGDNTLKLVGVLDARVPYSIVYLDSVDLTYQRLFRADGDQLTFTAPSGSTVTVSGFSSSDILVLDLGSWSQQPGVITPTISVAHDGSYQAQFATPSGKAPRSYLAAVKGSAKMPASVNSIHLAGLENRSNQADYVLIAPDSLVRATKSLAAYRSAQGLVTMVVALSDIYNEFNNGNPSPYAIQDFLRYATNNWQPRPRYATLVGRGTYDYKDYMGVGDCLVPPLMTATPYGLSVSDARLADLTRNDGVPEIALGRLPLLTSQDVADYLAKIQAREQASNPRRVLMAADSPDADGSFNVDSDAVAGLVSTDTTVLKVYLPAYSGTQGEQAIINDINNGVMIFNYFGHGGSSQLAGENFFQTSDVSALTNAPVMPIFLGMTCSVGNFGLPGLPSLAENMLLQQGGGTYASWASSGLSVESQSVLLDKAFFTAAFAKGTKTIGDVIVSSFHSPTVTKVPPSMKYLYNLLGEPVSKLP